ncbi:HD domain-containing protein [Blautia sp. HCP28S3_G10]|uniref:HD domain-containing protein n=1 Tax=Blautia sp. HCP28S3_G10 TaxID=3438908 RepID=UPI003F8BE62F
MDRINAIWNHPLYQQNLSELLNLESDRIFCRHTPEHFLDVARLTWIYILEERLDFSREIVYSAALLHDIGRARQYIDGTPHDEAGACIANTILTDLAFTEEEKSLIITAISEHRSSGTQTGILSRLLYKADKKSRNCFLCPALSECNWASEKKNMTLQY